MAFVASHQPAGCREVIWSEVSGIGDRAVFVNYFRAFCVEANGLSGLRSNCMNVAGSYGSYDDYGMEVIGGALHCLRAQPR